MMPDSSPSRALVVEDDPAWKDILVEILSDMGLAVEVAENMPGALGKITGFSHRLAVIDLSLGGSDHHNQDGLAVLDAVRLHDPGCVTILLTGFANVELAVSAISEHGAFTCLRKEMFNRRQFGEILDRALASQSPGLVTGDSGEGIQHAVAIPENADRIASSSQQAIHSTENHIPLSPGFALVVEDSASWRALLSELLEEAGFHVHPCSSYAEALGRLMRQKYRLAVIDLSLAGGLPPVSALLDAGFDGHNLDGFRLLAGARAGGIPTIVVSGIDDPDEIERAYTEHAIFAFIPKRVFNRRVFLDTVQELLKEVDATKTAEDRHAGLTGREKQVLDLLAKGMTNKEIADRMVISTNTVKRHIKAIFKKLEVHTRSAATARAVTVLQSAQDNNHAL